MHLQWLLIFVSLTVVQAKIRYSKGPVYSGLTILLDVDRVNGLLEGNETTIKFNASGVCRGSSKILAVSDNKNVMEVVSILFLLSLLLIKYVLIRN